MDFKKYILNIGIKQRFLISISLIYHFWRITFGNCDHGKIVSFYELYIGWWIDNFVINIFWMTCYHTYCANNCCNYYGYCPENYNSLYYSSTYTTCYSYYNSSVYYGPSVGTIVGAVIGGIIGLVIIVALICHFKKRKDF